MPPWHIEWSKNKEDQEVYYQFLKTLDMMALSYEPDGTPSGRNYILYAYCLMTNHIHLLIHERDDKKADRIMEFILKSGNMGHKRG